MEPLRRRMAVIVFELSAGSEEDLDALEKAWDKQVLGAVMGGPLNGEYTLENGNEVFVDIHVAHVPRRLLSKARKRRKGR